MCEAPPQQPQPSLNPNNQIATISVVAAAGSNIIISPCPVQQQQQPGITVTATIGQQQQGDDANNASVAAVAAAYVDDAIREMFFRGNRRRPSARQPMVPRYDFKKMLQVKLHGKVCSLIILERLLSLMA